jgi:hypothetical protein
VIVTDVDQLTFARIVNIRRQMLSLDAIKRQRLAANHSQLDSFQQQYIRHFRVRNSARSAVSDNKQP